MHTPPRAQLSPTDRQIPSPVDTNAYKTRRNDTFFTRPAIPCLSPMPTANHSAPAGLPRIQPGARPNPAKRSYPHAAGSMPGRQLVTSSFAGFDEAAVCLGDCPALGEILLSNRRESPAIGKLEDFHFSPAQLLQRSSFLRHEYVLQSVETKTSMGCDPMQYGNAVSFRSSPYYSPPACPRTRAGRCPPWFSLSSQRALRLCERPSLMDLQNRAGRDMDFRRKMTAMQTWRRQRARRCR